MPLRYGLKSVVLHLNMHGMDGTDAGALAAGRAFVAVEFDPPGFRIKMQGAGGTQGRAYPAMQTGFLVTGDLLGDRGDRDLVFLEIGDSLVVILFPA